MTRSRYSGRPHRIALLLAVMIPLVPTIARSAPDGFSLAAAEFDGEGESRKARDAPLPPIVLPIGVPAVGAGLEGLLLQCSAQATSDGKPRKGVRVTFVGEIVDLEGETVDTFSMTGKTTKKNDGWTDHLEFFLDPENQNQIQPPPGADEGDLLAAGLIQAQPQGGRELDTLGVNCGIGRPVECLPDATTGCLRNDRFRVKVSWTDPVDASTRQALPQAVDSESLLFFFPPLDVEMLVKILDNCEGPFGRFWVFYAATTNVEYTVTVTDTMTGVARDYGPPLLPLEPVTDTQAFATCP